MISSICEWSKEMRDFEVPNGITAHEFGKKIAWIIEGHESQDSDGFWFYVTSLFLGRPLRADETLEEAGILDGDILVISKKEKAKSKFRSADQYRNKPPVEHGPISPVAGWKTLDSYLKKSEQHKKRTSGARGTTRSFTWKGID